jgi:tetratricopeptide (TPR) repeat protein
VKREFNKAVADYTEAIRLDPNYDVAYQNRGRSYFAKRDYDRAIADYDQALRINPRYRFA